MHAFTFLAAAAAFAGPVHFRESGNLDRADVSAQCREAPPGGGSIGDARLDARQHGDHRFAQRCQEVEQLFG